MLCVTRTNSISNGPTVTASRGFIGTSRPRAPASSLGSSSASVSGVPYTGPSTCGSTYGTAPMWSSCPCVSTSAFTRPAYFCRCVRSGMIRSTPGRSGSGNITPASTTMAVSP